MNHLIGPQFRRISKYLLYATSRLKLLAIQQLNSYDFNNYTPIFPLISPSYRSTLPFYSSNIPQFIHIVWVGEMSQCPFDCIDTWRSHNPTALVILWSNKELFNLPWCNRDNMMKLWDLRCYNGVADMMRYEILFALGGFAVDADSICLKTLPPYLFHQHSFTCYESEEVKPGLLSSGYLASVPNTRLLKNIITSIRNDPNVCSMPAWISVGPCRLTSVFARTPKSRLKIFPSHFFIPTHYSGIRNNGPLDEIFADQLWGTTKGLYK